MRQRLRRVHFNANAIKTNYLSKYTVTLSKGNAPNQQNPLLTKPTPTSIIDAINEASPRFVVGKNAAYTDFPIGQCGVGNIFLHSLDETKGGLTTPAG
jgi:hypothetical protein